MKKTLIALAIFAASASTWAADVTTSVARNFGPDTTAGSVAIGQQFGAVRGEAVLGHTFTKDRLANTVGVNATYPLTTIAGATVAAKVGVSYVVTPGPAANGFAVNAGVEASYPLTKSLTLVSSLERVQGQTRINSINGNQFAVGLRASF